MQSSIRLNTNDNTSLKTQEQQQSLEQYKLFRRLHSRSNFVPEDFINYVIDYHFGEKSQVLYSYKNNEKLIKINIHDLLKVNIVNWFRNREPDLVRIPAISRYIFETRKIFKTIIYLNYNFKNDRFEIIDGLHRILSLELLNKLNLRINNITEETNWFLYEDMNWFYNNEIILHCCFHSNEEDLEEIRNTINFSQPMLIQDSGPEDLVKKNIINEIANEWQTRYKKNFSDSCNETYMKSNATTNRTKFIELLSFVYDKYNIDVNRILVLKQLLNEANNKVKEKVLSGEIKSNNKSKQRCCETGCYLFNLKNGQIEDII
jgi:hypothetical protein